MLQVKLPHAAMLVIAVATLGACSTEPVAPRLQSTATASALSRPASANAGGANFRLIDQTVWTSCANGGAGEAIHVTGELRYDVHLTQDANGVIHFNVKSNTSGLTGVGMTSGTTYRGMMAEHINSRALDYLNEDVRTTDMIRFVAPGSGAAYSLVATSHFIVDQGDYVLWDQTWTEVCR